MNHPNTQTKALALDLATTTGWADIANGVITSGSQNFSQKKKDPQGIQFFRFENWIKEKLRDSKPDSIAFEEVYRWMSSGAAHMFCGLRAIMLKEAIKAEVPVFAYSPTHIKKYWVGKGNAKKDAMIAETIRRYPALDLTDDNQADAIAILNLHLNQL